MNGFGAAEKVYVFSGAITLAVMLSLGAAQCGGAQKPVDTSQQILAEAGTALADVDCVVAARTREASEGAISRATVKVQAGRCNDGETSSACVLRHLREEMEIWYQLTAALETAHATLEVWQAANDGWRRSGSRPLDWEQRVCVPVGIMARTIVGLLNDADLPVPEAWQALMLKADKLCSLGVTVAAVAGADQDGGQ